MLTFVVLAALVLIAFGVAFDLVARRRGRYRSAEEWRAISRRRKTHLRTMREERRSRGTGGADGSHRR